ncbi:MAG: hypothetical protein U0790_16950 [Isosphaeraceae bacterium]
MRRVNLLVAVGGVVVGLISAAHWPLRAQNERGASDPARVAEAPHGPQQNQQSPARSVQEALLKPFRFAFRDPVSLTDLAGRLRQELGAPVVLDLAALDRLELKPEETVSLDLDGVRLKTGLKLLLDQVGLTYRVVPEDNLLILTDKEGADDPLDRLAAEVRELHRDVHEVQDAVDELLDQLNPTGDGPRVRKPTIIEELPDGPEAKPREKEDAPTAKSGTEPQPGGARPPGTPSARPRTRL